MNYRAEIDGLRALAVIPVIFYHAGFELFKGGFVGVDVFFVISGYLITSIILNDLEKNTFSIKNFYTRRVRRILPILFFISILCIPFVIFIFSPLEIKSFSQSILGVLTFTSNIFFWKEIGYFNPAVEMMPLIHTWSLAVEEQFYILFPIFLMMTWSFGKLRISIILFFIFVSSLFLAVWATSNYPTAGFYLLPTRAFEIVLGCFIAIFLNQNKNFSIDKKFSEVLGIIGFLLIAVSIIFFDKNTPFPSLYTLIPIIGTALIIIFVTKETSLYKFLTLRFIVTIGLISYGAYLWHQPIFAFLKYLTFKEYQQYIFLLATLVVFPLSYFSWKFIETPFRNKNRITNNVLYSVILISVIFLGTFSYLGSKDGFEKSFNDSEQIKAILSHLEPNYGLSKECIVGFTEKDVCKSGSEINTILWGDSYAMHLTDAFSDNPELSFIQHTMPSCRPIISMSVSKSKKFSEACIENNNKVLEWASKNRNIEYVLISSPFNFERFGIYDGGKHINYEKEIIRKNLLKTIELFRNVDKKVAIISPPPSPRFSAGQCFLKAYMRGKDPQICNFDKKEYAERTHEAYDLLKSLEDEVYIIWLDKILCKTNCTTSFGDTPVFIDDGHLTKKASKIIGDEFNLANMIIKNAS